MDREVGRGILDRCYHATVLLRARTGVPERIHEIHDARGLEETLDLRWFKWHRATAYYNIAVDLDYTPKLYPQSLRLGTLRYLPESYVPDAAAAPTDVLRFLRAVARINLLSPTDRWDRWHASVRDYIDNRVDEANGLLPADLRELTDGNIKRYIARMKLLAEVFMDRLWIGNFVCTSIEMGVFAQMLAKWYDGDNAFVFQDLISGSGHHPARAGDARLVSPR